MNGMKYWPNQWPANFFGGGYWRLGHVFPLLVAQRYSNKNRIGMSNLFGTSISNKCGARHETHKNRFGFEFQLYIYIYIYFVYIYATFAAFMSTLRRINVQQKIGTRHFRGLMRVDAIWYSRPQSDGFPSLGKTTSPATKGWPTSMLRYFHDFPCNSSHIRDFPVTYTRLVPPFVNAKLGFALLSNFTWVYDTSTT